MKLSPVESFMMPLIEKGSDPSLRQIVGMIRDKAGQRAVQGELVGEEQSKAALYPDGHIRDGLGIRG